MNNYYNNLELIEQYDNAGYNLCYEFAKSYFEEDDLSDTDFEFKYWCLFLNEWEVVFDIDEVYECIKYNIPVNIMLDWFDYCFDCSCKNKKRTTNLYNFWKYKTVPKKQLEKEKLEEIEKAKASVDKTAQYFAKALGISKDELLKSFNEA